MNKRKHSNIKFLASYMDWFNNQYVTQSNRQRMIGPKVTSAADLLRITLNFQ